MQRKAALIRCVDYRHGGRLVGAITEFVGPEVHLYELTEPGGAGLLTGDIFTGHPHGADWLLEKIKIAIAHLGAQELILTVHGPSEEDPAGCGGYHINGFGDVQADPVACHEFSHNQLRMARDMLREKGIEVPMTAFYITFGPRGENNVHPVPLN